MDVLTFGDIMNLKMLPLQRWMIDYAEHDQGIPAKHECFEKLRVSQHSYMTKSYPRLGDTSWPDGRFLSGDECFFVLNNIMYTEDGAEMFKYEMKLQNEYEALTRVDKILELYDLEVQLFGKATKDTIRLRSAIGRLKERQQMRKGLAMMKKRLKEKVKERKNETN